MQQVIHLLLKSHFFYVLQVVENVDNIKQIEVNTSGRAEFEFNMKLKDTNSKIYLYKVSANGFTLITNNVIYHKKKQQQQKENSLLFPER